MSVLPNTCTFLSLKYFIYKQNVCRRKQSHNNLIWLIRCKYWPQRFVLSSVIVCACVLYCMCTTAFALVTISHQRPCQSVLGLCICYPSRLDTCALSLSWLDYTLLYSLPTSNSPKTFFELKFCGLDEKKPKKNVCTGNRVRCFYFPVEKWEGFCWRTDVPRCCNLTTPSSACMANGWWPWTKWFLPKEHWKAFRLGDGHSLSIGFYMCWRK